MRPEARGYLRDLARRLKLDPARKQEILQELEGHVEDRAQAFQDRGFAPDEATHRSLELLGQPRHLARQYYAIHSLASWGDVIISILPHLLFAALFALHLWSVSFWVALFLISAAVITVTAWRRGQPKWSYPWLGYCLVAPVVGWALALRTMSNGIWSVLNGEPLPLFFLAYVGMLVYMVLVLALLWGILRRVVQRDWLYASLAALPFPFLTAWLIYLGEHGGYFNYDAGRLLEMDRRDGAALHRAGHHHRRGLPADAAGVSSRRAGAGDAAAGPDGRALVPGQHPVRLRVSGADPGHRHPRASGLHRRSPQPRPRGRAPGGVAAVGPASASWFDGLTTMDSTSSPRWFDGLTTSEMPQGLLALW